MKRKKMITWLLMWLNESIATLNSTLQLLVIYWLIKNHMTRLTRPKIIETVVSRFNLFFFFFLFLPWSHLSNISYHSSFFFFLSFSPSLNKWLLWYCKITLKEKTYTPAKLTIIFFHILNYLTRFLHYKYFKHVFL